MGDAPPLAVGHLHRESALARGEIILRSTSGDTPVPYYVFVPASARHQAPIWVSVHGLSENARDHALQLSAWAARLGAVLVAPHFEAERYPD